MTQTETENQMKENIKLATLSVKENSKELKLQQNKDIKLKNNRILKRNIYILNITETSMNMKHIKQLN